MQHLLDTYFANSEHYDLYCGAIEAVNGLLRSYPEDSWIPFARGSEPKLIEEFDQKLAASGLLGLGVPEEFGGMGGGFFGQVILARMMAERGITSFKSMVTAFCRHPIIAQGTREQKEKYIPATAAGESTICILATEPNAGTNTFNISTKAKREGDKWILNGQKIWISGADIADYGFLIAKTDLDKPGALSIFIIDMKSPGITMQELNSQVFPVDSQYSVFFEDVELPADALVGEEGKGAVYMFDGLNPERFITTAGVIGSAQLALKVTKDYVNQRAPFGKPTGSYQAVQHPLAKHKISLDAAELMLAYGVKLYDEGKPAAIPANQAKYLGSEAACAMTDAAIQAHGGSGMDEDTGLLALWRYTRTLRIAPINNEMVLNFVAEHGIGLPKSY